MENKKWKKFFSYYKPYKKLFAADMFFACLAAAITLVIPLIIRFITNDVIYRESEESIHFIFLLIGVMIVLIVIEFYSNFFITNYGHMMGAKMEYDMRNEIFSHYQKLSFSFFDNQKVGQLMSRVTNDLFEISELFHHGPEDIVISIIETKNPVFSERLPGECRNNQEINDFSTPSGTTFHFCFCNKNMTIL